MSLSGKKPGDSIISRTLKPTMLSALYNSVRDITYKIGDYLGIGSFATCYNAICDSTGAALCCKAIWKAKLTGPEIKQQVRNEIKIQRQMDHPNIVKYHSSMEDTNYVYLFVELCTCGSLKELLDVRKTLTEPEVRIYMRQLISAVEYLKGENTIHRDLKLANIFIADDMTLKIGDFGLACAFNPGKRRTTFCGTLNYMAPELVSASTHSFEVDLWALGVIMYTLLVGNPPFSATHEKAIVHKILTLGYTFPKYPGISLEAKDLIEKILQTDPDSRLSFQQIWEHPFFHKASLSSDTAQALATTNSAKKRCLGSDGLAQVSTNCAPRKKTKLQTAEGPKSPAPVPRIFAFKDLEECNPTFIQKKNDNFISSYQKAASADQSENSGAEIFIAETENLSSIYNYHEDISNPAMPSIEDAFNIHLKMKELISSGHTRAEIENLIGKADLTIPNFISKWIYHGKHYSHAYEFIDGTSGVCFPDMSTLSMSPDKEHFEYIEVHGSQYQATHYTRVEVEKIGSSKMALFERYIEALRDEPPIINNVTKQALLPLSVQSNSAEAVSNSSSYNLPFVTKVLLTEHGTFFRLSNSHVQINPVGGISFVLSDEGHCIVTISKEVTAIKSYALLDFLLQNEQPAESGHPIEASLSAFYEIIVDFLGSYSQLC